MTTLLLILFLLFLTVAVIYAFLLMPRCTERPSFDGLIADYAHHGLHGEGIPENSTAAFCRARDEGYGIALDLRLSGEGEVVAGGVRLSEVLDLVGGDVPLLLELCPSPKRDDLCRETARLLDAYDGAFCVASADPRILSYFKHYRPQFVRGQRTEYLMKDKRLSFFLRLSLTYLLCHVHSRPDFVVFPETSARNLSVLLCRHVFRIRGFVFGVRDEKLAKKMKAVGCPVIFDGIRPET